MRQVVPIQIMTDENFKSTYTSQLIQYNRVTPTQILVIKFYFIFFKYIFYIICNIIRF